MGYIEFLVCLVGLHHPRYYFVLRELTLYPEFVLETGKLGLDDCSKSQSPGLGGE
jgi:hypothetical protein